MKARIDTKAKTIAIEETVSMDDLLKFVKFVAGDDWKAWKVETNVKFEVTSLPIIIRDYSRPWTNPYWYGLGETYSGASSGGVVSNAEGTTMSVPQGQGTSMNTVSFLDFQPTNN